MRRYAALYLKSENVWMVIFQDDGEEEWYEHTPNAGSQSNAVELAQALNAMNGRS